MSVLVLTNKTFSKVITHFRQSAKYCVNVSDPSNMFPFKSHFSSEEQAKILKIINGSNPHQLSRLNVPQNRIKNIERWKNKKGPFRSLSEVLEVDGLGEKILEEICVKIITENYTAKSNNDVNKKIKQLVTPALTGNIVNDLKSSVGLHLSPTGISWAKLNREQNKLDSWHFETFSTLPIKMLPTDTFDLAMKVVRRIPPSDIYIFEASPALNPQVRSQSDVVSSYTSQVELTSMLMALLNTSINHNRSLQKINPEGVPRKTIDNRVFSLRSNLPARLFKTLVGQEKVAAIQTITELVESDANGDFAFRCTPISIEPQLKQAFMSQSPSNKELLCQSLMLVISFMDLYVYKNNVTVSAISDNEKPQQKKIE